MDNEELDWDDATLDKWLAFSNNGDTIPARMLNGMWASLDLRKGTSLGPFYSKGFPEFLFKTSKSHWFILRNKESGFQSLQITLSHAIDWLVERGVPLSYAPINLTELEDATEVAPLSNEKLVIRCLHCRALALKQKKLVRRERQRPEGLSSNIYLSIISVLKRAKNPLSGKEIATRAHLKNNSHFRGTLARLIQSGDIQRRGGLRSYVLGDRHLS